ncbi:MAG: hypothetical protein HYR72_27235 [Deltaproteobacteria bacterium]|nr:hypothetical protein [Deltaproteobacteria bacterium]MBI3390291.1 hypothetical protein [Deltaproteobacteria bacterium]
MKPDLTAITDINVFAVQVYNYPLVVHLKLEPARLNVPCANHPTWMVFVFFLLAVARANATCIIAHWSPDEIIVGADSMTVRHQGTARTPTFAACKIRPIGSNAFAAITGLDGSISSDSPYIAAGEGWMDGDTTSERMSNIEGNMVTWLLPHANTLRMSDSSYWKSHCVNGSPFETALIFGVIDGALTIIRSDFTIVPDGTATPPFTIHVDRESCPPKCPVSGFIPLGDEVTIDLYEMRHHSWTGTETVEQIITGLIKDHETAFPNDVGGDTDILHVIQSGYHWTALKKECGDPHAQPRKVTTPDASTPAPPSPYVLQAPSRR